MSMVIHEFEKHLSSFDTQLLLLENHGLRMQVCQVLEGVQHLANMSPPNVKLLLLISAITVKIKKGLTKRERQVELTLSEADALIKLFKKQKGYGNLCEWIAFSAQIEPEFTKKVIELLVESK